MNVSMKAIQLHQVSYSYDQLKSKALDRLDLSIGTGECVALLGPNGAGKSTLLQLLTGQLQLQYGQLHIFDQTATTKKAAEKLGYSPQEVEFPKNLSVLEVLIWVASHRNQNRNSSFEKIIISFQLQALLHRKCHQLSGGERKRLSLACAFLGQPPLVILDEPTNHLDLQSRQSFSSFIKLEKKKGTCILFASHYMAEVQEMADRVCVLNKGRLLQDTTPDTLCKNWGIHKIQFQASQLNLIEEDDMKNMVQQWEIHNDQHTLWSHQPELFVRQLVLKNIDFSQLQIEKANLEDVLKTIYHQDSQT